MDWGNFNPGGSNSYLHNIDHFPGYGGLPPAQPRGYASSLVISEDSSTPRSRSSRQKVVLSSSSSSSNGTSPPSIFDDWRTRSSSVSTAPPLHGPDAGRRPPVLPAIPPVMPPAPPLDPSLPCEFDGFSGCRERFNLWDVDLWIEHISGVHLKYLYPKRSQCWVCPQMFEARDGNHQAAFEARLRHIAQHYQNNDVTGDISPDFCLLGQVDMNNRRAFGHAHAARAHEPRPMVPEAEQWNRPQEKYRRRRDGSIVYR